MKAWQVREKEKLSYKDSTEHSSIILYKDSWYEEVRISTQSFFGCQEMPKVLGKRDRLQAIHMRTKTSIELIEAAREREGERGREEKREMKR